MQASRILLTLTCLLNIAYSYGQSQLDSLVNLSVQRYLQTKGAVGISIGIVIKDSTWYYNYGETKAGNGQVPTNKSVYEIGSISKTFTGILLGQAVVDKKIGLDDDIRQYLKGDYPNLEYHGTPIRVKDLSNHTSRISRIFPNVFIRPGFDKQNPLKNYDRELLFAGLHNMQLDTIPGRIHSYSNMGIAILGAIVEDAYGQSWYTLVSKYILEPYSMHDTRVDLSGIPNEQIAWPHDTARHTVPLWDISALPAMGGLRSTTIDLVQYIKANNTAATPAIALSHQFTYGTSQEGIGLNWFIHTSHSGVRIIEHNGGTGGSTSALECFPDLKAGFVILSNSLANANKLEKELATIVIAQASKN